MVDIKSIDFLSWTLRNLIASFFLHQNTKTKTGISGKESKCLAIQMHLVTINVKLFFWWKKKSTTHSVVFSMDSKLNCRWPKTCGPKRSPLCGGQWTNTRFGFMGEKKLIAFPSQRLSHPVWTTGKDPLKLCLLIWERLGYFYLSGPSEYKSRRTFAV